MGNACELEGEPVCIDTGRYEGLQCREVTRAAAKPIVSVFASPDPPKDAPGFKECIARVVAGTWRDFVTTNQSMGSKGAKLGSIVVGGSIAARYESFTPLKWALKGFGPLPAEFTKSGAIQVFEFTTAQRALLVGKAMAAKFLFVTVAFEGGILVGSVINQTLSDETNDLIGGTINEIVNEEGWKLLFKHPFGIGM
jgi:hypothetical protein